MRGRRPIDSNLRLLRTDRIHRKKQAPEQMGAVPECPALVAEVPEAAAKWNEITAQLQQARMLSHLSADTIANYCIEWSHYVQCEQWVRQHGDVITIRSDKGEVKTVMVAPHETQRLKHLDRLIKLQIELGITPAGRAKVPKLSPSEQNPWADAQEQRFFGPPNKLTKYLKR